MDEPRLTLGQRAQVVAFAERWGPTEAARRFRVPVGSVKGWTYRARARARRQAARTEADQARARELATAAPDPAEAELADRMRRGVCLRCGGSGRVRIGAVMRGTLTIRRPRVIVCPDCGGQPRHLQVVEHDRESWRHGQAVAGDLGAGWTPELWALIRAGEVDPDGYRWTGPSDD